ncbi:ABC transporter permease [Georgenia sp. TF02-10]|uniref:ABC transporter permease n=1 Tax=Georgenia sp. TF02-10 TaxID=2917725 RepID=UPI001FA80F80|nr:ABC transporter permease [Georgenia sp. TF02-10]UNX55771.1 ABC transporter permease [Georgenia sp. TF02-10]
MTTYFGIELRRVARDYVTMFFVAVLPAFLYVIFGATQDYASAPAGHGNAALYTMISMAAYGAVTATTGVGGMAAVERMQGWGRQLALTPLPDSGYVAVKAGTAFVIAAVPVVLIYALGFFTGAEGTAGAWLGSGLLVLVGAAAFSLYGLLAGLLFRTEAAVGAASGSLVVLGFLGNVFVPLSGGLLTFAQLTPLYGYVALARYPLTEGVLIGPAGPGATQALWVPVLNLVVWAGVFAVAALLLVRRRGRQ